ncbi:MAG: hypothetical protein ACI4OS_03980, partial [Akkermansia sp.]
MKKTLFLAAMLACFSAPVHADNFATTLPDGCESSDMTGILVNETNGTITVGCYKGDAMMTVVGTDESSTVALDKQLFIGGKGYGQPVSTGGSGTVTIAANKVLTVAGQVGVGNTKIAGATGTLILEAGAKLIADQIVVGSQNGQGTVRVGDGAVLETTGGTDSTIIIGGASKDEEGHAVVSSGNCSGTVIVEQGGQLNAPAGILVGSYGSGSGTLEVQSEKVSLAAVKIGGDSAATGEVIINVAASSGTSQTVPSMQDVTVA